MKCVVCAERYRDGFVRGLCVECNKSLGLHKNRTDASNRYASFADMIEWAAKRARRFERARARAANDPARRRVREALETAGIDPERFATEWCRAQDEHEAEEIVR